MTVYTVMPGGLVTVAPSELLTEKPEKLLVKVILKSVTKKP